MPQKHESKQKILKTALNLFHEQGVHATGIDQILKQSGTGKGQFYHFFKNKDDLTHRVMQMIITYVKAGGPEGKFHIRSWKHLEQWFHTVINDQISYDCKRSCPVGTIGAEIRNDQTQLLADVNEFFDVIRSNIREFLIDQKKKGKISKACDPDSLADFCVSLTQGGLLVAKIHRDITPFKNATKHAIKYLRSFKT